MSDLVNREPQSGQGAQREQEEAHELKGGGSRAWNAIWDVDGLGPDGADHELNTLTSQPGLDAVPNTRHSSAVKHGPVGTKDTEGRS